MLNFGCTDYIQLEKKASIYGKCTEWQTDCINIYDILTIINQLCIIIKQSSAITVHNRLCEL